MTLKSLLLRKSVPWSYRWIFAKKKKNQKIFSLLIVVNNTSVEDRFRGNSCVTDMFFWCTDQVIDTQSENKMTYSFWKLTGAKDSGNLPTEYLAHDFYSAFIRKRKYKFFQRKNVSGKMLGKGGSMGIGGGEKLDCLSYWNDSSWQVSRSTPRFPLR